MHLRCKGGEGGTLYLWDYVQMAEGEELWVKHQLPDPVSSGRKQQLWGLGCTGHSLGDRHNLYSTHIFPLERKYLHMLIEIKIQTYCKKLNRAAARCAMGSLLSVRTEGESKKYSLRGLLPFAHRLCIARNTPTCLPRTI